jgi:hypothetical protein
VCGYCDRAADVVDIGLVDAAWMRGEESLWDSGRDRIGGLTGGFLADTMPSGDTGARPASGSEAVRCFPFVCLGIGSGGSYFLR